MATPRRCASTRAASPSSRKDDIFLLLTLGVTRAELDQVQSSALGESVVLQALGALTGADQVVTEAIPVIDEFRLGSLSSRTGRTEPAVTIGKRLSERIRAFVTSGLSETRDVRSNVEVRINRSAPRTPASATRHRPLPVGATLCMRQSCDQRYCRATRNPASDSVVVCK